MSASLEDTSPFNDSNHENNQDGGKVLIGPDDVIQKTNQPTENDEINFVDKGFDSGWLNVQGLAPEDFSNEGSNNLGGK